MDIGIIDVRTLQYCKCSSDACLSGLINRRTYAQQQVEYPNEVITLRIIFQRLKLSVFKKQKKSSTITKRKKKQRVLYPFKKKQKKNRNMQMHSALLNFKGLILIWKMEKKKRTVLIALSRAELASQDAWPVASSTWRGICGEFLFSNQINPCYSLLSLLSLITPSLTVGNRQLLIILMNPWLISLHFQNYTLLTELWLG